MKTCTKCGEFKTLDSFRKDKAKKSGRGARCKTCTNARRAELYAADPAPEKKRADAWRAANPERLKAYRRAYYAANTDMERGRKAAWTAKNLEYIRGYAKDHSAKRRAANPELNKKDVERLAPSYVAARLGIFTGELTPELLALKREQLEIHRLAKQVKQQLKESKK